MQQRCYEDEFRDVKKKGGGERPRERREMPCHSHNSDKFQRGAKRILKKKKDMYKKKKAKSESRKRRQNKL